MVWREGGHVKKQRRDGEDGGGGERDKDEGVKKIKDEGVRG